MKRSLLGVALLCLTVLPAGADDASKRAKVEELFTVMRLDRTTEQLVNAVRQQTQAMMRTMPGFDAMSDGQKAVVEQFQNRVMALVTGAVGWKAVEPQMVVLYANSYSEGEIDGLLTFYKSPVGQTMLDKTPELTAESLKITQSKAVGLQPQIGALMEEFAKQFAAAAKPQGAPATPGGGGKS